MTTSIIMQTLNRLLALSSTLSSFAVWVGGALTLASVALVCYDVIVRKAFGITLSGADELSGYAFAISTTWAMAFAVLNRAHIRVDALYQLLPIRLAAVLDWLALVCLATFFAYLTRYAYEVVATSWIQQSMANTPMATPMWIPQSLWALGLAWMCLVLSLMLIRASCALVKGDLESLHEICGVRSTKEEAEEEAANGERIIQGERA